MVRLVVLLHSSPSYSRRAGVLALGWVMTKVSYNSHYRNCCPGPGNGRLSVKPRPGSGPVRAAGSGPFQPALSTSGKPLARTWLSGRGFGTGPGADLESGAPSSVTVLATSPLLPCSAFGVFLFLQEGDHSRYSVHAQLELEDDVPADESVPRDVVGPKRGSAHG